MLTIERLQEILSEIKNIENNIRSCKHFKKAIDNYDEVFLFANETSSRYSCISSITAYKECIQNMCDEQIFYLKNKYKKYIKILKENNISIEDTLEEEI